MNYLGTRAFVNQFYGECTGFYFSRDNSTFELMVQNESMQIVSLIEFPGPGVCDFICPTKEEVIRRIKERSYDEIL